jgi:2-keto-4-pentenoate hydratase
VTDRVARCAAILSDARLQRRRLPMLAPDLRPNDEIGAYAIQEAAHRLLTASGHGQIVGHKIGCTTPVMQAFLGIANPCAGGIFSSTVYRNSVEPRYSDFLHVGVECEIAVRLERDLPAAEGPFDRSKVGAAVGACMAAMEIVDDRYVDYKTMDTPTLIADDFFNAACVLGPEVCDWRELDLAALTGTTSINGVEVGQGKSSAVMGHPIEALSWLANSRARRGLGLRRGEFVLTGSVVETRWVSAGDQVIVAVSDLGCVEARFRAE